MFVTLPLVLFNEWTHDSLRIWTRVTSRKDALLYVFRMHSRARSVQVLGGGNGTMEGKILPGGGRGMTASEVWGMRPQNGDSQHGVPSLNIGRATKCNGRLVYLSDHVGTFEVICHVCKAYELQCGE
jgi:hypothetical protein